MFWKKKPKCPITIEDKEWIEAHLDWINKKVVRIEKQPIILPEKEFFDWDFKGDEKDAEFVLRQIGTYCKINTNRINLDFYSEESVELARGMVTKKEEGAGTAGLYKQKGGKASILIEVQQLKKPDALIATMVHELSHYVLMKQKRVYLPGAENEWLTDLLAIAYGFGIFIGNAKLEFNQWQSGDGWGGWQYSSQGYLPQQITAYAMAAIEIRRSAEIPSWIKYLKNDFRRDFKRSMQYLQSIE